MRFERQAHTASTICGILLVRSRLLSKGVRCVGYVNDLGRSDTFLRAVASLQTWEPAAIGVAKAFGRSLSLDASPVPRHPSSPNDGLAKEEGESMALGDRFTFFQKENKKYLVQLQGNLFVAEYRTRMCAFSLCCMRCERSWTR